ncbi:hypothetical protein ACFQ69_24865 [Streptomyces sp. NPDC056470]|uniref:hypothetical protein n=1 Tax=Streptomyces sp. NPDC056470 TaxID=3345831 RepID=UPI00367ACB0A
MVDDPERFLTWNGVLVQVFVVLPVGEKEAVAEASFAGRYTVTDTEPFAYGTTAQRQSRRNLIASLEDALRLHQHTPGSLVKLHGYLHECTYGAIGSLSQLVRGAALEAIINGSEAVTRKTPETIRGRPDRRGRSPGTPPQPATRRQRPDADAA